MQTLLDTLVDGPYDAVYMLGSAGCGKSKALRDVHALAMARFDVTGAAHCANSGRVAVNVGGRCTTFGKRLHNGSFRASHEHGYKTVAVARDVADIKVLLVEEATSIAPRMFSDHVAKLKAAKDMVNAAVSPPEGPLEYPDVDSPVHGVKMLASGDYLQQIFASGGVGKVDEAGTCHLYVPPADDSTPPGSCARCRMRTPGSTLLSATVTVTCYLRCF